MSRRAKPCSCDRRSAARRRSVLVLILFVSFTRATGQGAALPDANSSGTLLLCEHAGDGQSSGALTLGTAAVEPCASQALRAARVELDVAVMSGTSIESKPLPAETLGDVLAADELSAEGPVNLEEVTPVSEPSTWIVGALALISIATARRRRLVKFLAVKSFARMARISSLMPGAIRAFRSGKSKCLIRQRSGTLLPAV